MSAQIKVTWGGERVTTYPSQVAEITQLPCYEEMLQNPMQPDGGIGRADSDAGDMNPRKQQMFARLGI